MICGGVSVGAHDHVRPSLEALGARELFWGLALKPGHPTWFGTLGTTLVFGLPGNPVSAMVTFALLVRPALRGAGRDACPGTAADGGDRRATTRSRPGARTRCAAGSQPARTAGTPSRPAHQGSHVLSSMLGADALAIIPSDVVAVRAGERVSIEPLRPWIGALA